MSKTYGDPAHSDWLLFQPVDEHDSELMPAETEIIRKMPHCNAMIRECIGYIEEILREKGKLR